MVTGKEGMSQGLKPHIVCGFNAQAKARTYLKSNSRFPFGDDNKKGGNSKERARGNSKS